MKMTMTSHTRLTDRELLDATAHAVRCECRSTAELLSLLAELDTRGLYLKQGCSSLFTYCTNVLHLSEPAAYSRITAARAARTFPNLLDRLADGDITLTTITLLAAHLTTENLEPLLDAARHKTKRDVEQLIANLCRQPDMPTVVRRIATGTSPSPRLLLCSDSSPAEVSAPVAATGAGDPANSEARHGADRGRSLSSSRHDRCRHARASATRARFAAALHARRGSVSGNPAGTRRLCRAAGKEEGGDDGTATS